jgi:hypothetical protein
MESSPYSENSWHQVREEVGGSEVWSLVDAYGRPVRNSRVRINYREEAQDGTDSNSESSDNEDIHQIVLRKPKENLDHSAIFQMVLNAMHGDLTIPDDLPTIRDLALICSEVLDIERQMAVKRDPHELISSSEIRQSSNITPTPAPSPRDVPTPPGTPAFYKPQSYSGSMFAPMPISMSMPMAMQAQMAHYSQYADHYNRGI